MEENQNHPMIEIVINNFTQSIQPVCSCDDLLEMMKNSDSFIMVKDIKESRILIQKASINMIIGYSSKK